MKKKSLVIGAVVAVVVLGGAGIAVAATDPFDGDDRLTGTSLERASEAALAEVGEGTVREAEKSDDLDHSYLVEVRLTDGSEADVALDEDYNVVWVDLDNENDSSTSTGTDSNGTDSNGTDSNGMDSSGTATTAPTNGDADDVPLTDAERTSAEAAALAQVGSGTVTDIDRSDDADHAFEVEVTQADGTDVDVELDSNFSVVRVDDDSL
jgi:uncharacterized membrane protein YkoI